MLGYEDGRLRMTLGDHGVPLLLRVSRYCPKKGDGPEAKDRIRAELLQSGKRVFAREIAYGELEAAQGIMELFLTPEEAEKLSLGLYTFRVLLLREGEVRNTLFTTTLEVVP